MMQMFAGVAAARVNSLYYTARKKSPCIIFIDEVDAIGRSRWAEAAGSALAAACMHRLPDSMAPPSGLHDARGAQASAVVHAARFVTLYVQCSWR
jgi:SpoVK/Ycf46/Vps4 family AAA+-type ATPase